MSYNLKCCSFYPNNFDASALEMNHIVIVPRPRYMRTPTDVHAYPDRGTCVPRPRYDDFNIRFHSLLFISRRFSFKGTNLYPLCFRVLIICGRRL